jgi:antitoxin component of RelBE/YafQ-DinJ toxin-antitoxin module
MNAELTIDNRLLQEADQVALAMGLTRSALVALAVTEFLDQRRAAKTLAQLNDAHRTPDEDDRLVVAGLKEKFRTVVRDAW